MSKDWDSKEIKINMAGYGGDVKIYKWGVQNAPFNTTLFLVGLGADNGLTKYVRRCETWAKFTPAGLICPNSDARIKDYASVNCVRCAAGPIRYIAGIPLVIARVRNIADYSVGAVDNAISQGARYNAARRYSGCTHFFSYDAPRAQ